MDTYKIIITVAGLGLAVILSVVAELLCKAQAVRRASRTQRQPSRKSDDIVETPDDEQLSSHVSRRS